MSKRCEDCDGIFDDTTQDVNISITTHYAVQNLSAHFSNSMIRRLTEAGIKISELYNAVGALLYDYLTEETAVEFDIPRCPYCGSEDFYEVNEDGEVPDDGQRCPHDHPDARDE